MSNGSKDPTPIAQRNRSNALKSTGPVTVEGKAIARGNAVRHGLTANPAAGVVEDPAEFDQLIRDVEEALQPRNAVEAGLVQRIAASLWRLRRATVVDGAISGISARAVVSRREEVQRWIGRITEHWEIEHVKVPLPRSLRAERRRPGLPRFRFERIRSGLKVLDDFRTEELMRSGAGITAMIMLLRQLADDLKECPQAFPPEACEQLLWLLGAEAKHFPVNADEASYPDQYTNQGSLFRMVGRGRQRKPGKPLPPELVSTIRMMIDTLRAQRELCEEPYTNEHDERRRRAALLPDAPLLDRLARYEVHALRSLERSLDMLAKLRGATVEKVAASLRGVNPDGSAVELRGERTTWRPGKDLGGGD